MDAEQISLHQIQEPQAEEVIDTQHNGQQSYFVNKSIQQLKLLKCHNLSSALFKTTFIIICLIPIFRYSKIDGNEILQILFIFRLILEIFKLFEVLSLYYLVKAQLDNVLEFQNQAQVSYQVSDLDDLSVLSWVIYKKSKQVMYYIIFMNCSVPYFCILLFTLLYLSYVQTLTIVIIIYQIIASPNKLFQIIIMCVIVSIDCLFFIIPLIFGAFVGCYQKIHQFTQKQFSINSKIIKKLKIQTYTQGLQLSEDNICIICWDTFKELEKFVILPCNTGHVYHHQCIIYWLKINTSCPACRYQLN